MITKLSSEDMRSLQYFLEERGDIERHVQWEEFLPIIKRDYPALYYSWRKYKIAKEVYRATARDVFSKIEDEV